MPVSGGSRIGGVLVNVDTEFVCGMEDGEFFEGGAEHEGWEVW
jgi:hypothetical protein